MFWGLCEAMDLYGEYLNAFKKDAKQKDEEGVSKPKVEEGDSKTKGEEGDSKPKVDEGDTNQEEGEGDSKHVEGNGDSKQAEVEGVCTPKENDQKDEGDANEAHQSDKETNEEDDRANISQREDTKIDGDEKAKVAADIPNTSESRDTLNVLLFGSGDPRHIIKTMAKLYSHRAGQATPPEIHFYMVDAYVEVVARNFLLLAIALEKDLMLRQKVHLFMDVYGNSLMRPYTQHYVAGKARSLLNILTDEEAKDRLAPFMDFDALKYRERDGVENALNFWLSREPNIFDVQKAWEMRLRHKLQTRYDYRDGVFDWDLNMVLKYRGANQLCNQEYRYWRGTGIAFTFPEYEQCIANRTLAADLRRNGSTIVHRGYLGDMETGPYAAFGLKTDDSRLTKSSHGTNDYRATDVTERNLLELFHELATGSAYEHDLEMSRKYGCVSLQMGKLLDEIDGAGDAAAAYNKPWLQIAGVKISFLSVEELLNLQSPRPQWQRFFDICFVSSMYFKLLKADFQSVMRDKSLMLLETKLWSLEKKEEVAEYEKLLKQLAKGAGYTGVINYQALNGQYAVMKFKRSRAKDIEVKEELSDKKGTSSEKKEDSSKQNFELSAEAN